MKELNYEKMKETEEFPNFMSLPLHIKQKVLEKCADCRQMMNLAETSTEMNQILVDTPHLMRKLKLVLNFTRENIENVNKISIILANATTTGRQYERLKLVHIHDAIRQSPTAESFFFKTLGLIASNVNELEVTNTNITAREFQKVIQCFGKLRSLNLNGVHLEDMPTHFINREFMPDLTQLTIRESTSTFMYFFKDFDKLRCFKFTSANKEQLKFYYGTEQFEDFIFQQKNLQTLSIGKMHRHRLKLDPFMMKSRSLECLSINRFFLQNMCAVNFFRQQQQLKSIKLYDFFDPRCFNETSEYCQILRTIFTLPKLQFVGIFHQTLRSEDFIFIHDIRNYAVRHLEHDMLSASIEKFLDIFPALEKISLRSQTVRLRDFPCEKLLKIESSGNYVIGEFAYQPTKITHDVDTFERIVKSFLMRNKFIKSLTLGYENWIDYNYSLSTEFWIEVIYHLTELTDVTIYNPRDIKRLVMLLGLSQNKFNSIIIYTDKKGKQEAKDCENDFVKIITLDRCCYNNNTNKYLIRSPS